jgi:hypothetical protein
MTMTAARELAGWAVPLPIEENGRPRWEHQTHNGEIRGRVAGPTEQWERNTSDDTIECADCHFTLEYLDKRYDRYWLHKLGCPACERVLFLTDTTAPGEHPSVDDLKNEYVSGLMSLKSFEASIESGKRRFPDEI